VSTFTENWLPNIVVGFALLLIDVALDPESPRARRLKALATKLTFRRGSSGDLVPARLPKFISTSGDQTVQVQPAGMILTGFPPTITQGLAASAYGRASGSCDLSTTPLGATRGYPPSRA
jgi:hypothetical protein